MNTVAHRYEAMHLPAWPFARLLVFWGGRQHGFDAFRLNPVEYARAVQCPALVLVGENDPWVRVTEARAVTEAMNGHGQRQVLKDGGHAAHAGGNPVAYRKTVGAWLTKITQAMPHPTP